MMRALLILLLVAAPASANVATGAEKWRAGDWDGAVAEWVAPAARGDADAMFNMGQAYRLGRGVPQSMASALDYYRRAAAKGHVGATANLGITLWQDGRRTEALGHLRTAADRGDLRAAYVLGLATFSGDGAPRNPALGYAYLLRARDGGLAQASGQAARVATLLTPDQRARGEAAAAALAAGRPVAVVLADMQVAQPAPFEPAPAPTGSATEEEDGEAAPSPAPSRSTRKDRPARDAAAEQAKPPEAQVSEDGWRVQLGAYANERSARTAWATLVSQSASLLKGLKPVYAPKGGLVRLQVGPFGEKDEAGDLCARLSGAGRPCFVTR